MAWLSAWGFCISYREQTEWYEVGLRMQVDRLKAFRGQACVITHNFGHLSWLMKSSCWCIGQPQGFQKKSCLA